MRVGYKRTLISRMGATIGFACGAVGVLAGFTQHSWKLGATGWFTGGTLLTLIAVFVLVDGAIAYQKARVAARSLDD